MHCLGLFSLLIFFFVRSCRVALDPSAPKDLDTLASTNLVFNSNRTTHAIPGVNSRVLTGEERAALRLKRKAAEEDPADLESWSGPWATRETDADLALRTVEGRVLTDEQRAEAERVHAKKRKGAAGPAADSEEAKQLENAAQAALESSVFHGTDLHDYQGRSYLSPPSTLHVPASNDLKCYLPKRLVHTFTGHTKGVNAIKFFPTTGHLLLSASNDKTVKLWNVVSSAHGGYKCLRTFSGHGEAVRAVDFNHDGSRFMTCSYDKYDHTHMHTHCSSLCRAASPAHLPGLGTDFSIVSCRHFHCSLIFFLFVVAGTRSCGTLRLASASLVTARARFRSA